MKIAINVAVYNESDHINKLLESLLVQTKMPDEIIIVDDGSKDDTAKIIKKFAAENPTIRYLYQKNAGPSAARNNAWKNSAADICIFTDGDCVPQKNWIETMLPYFEDEKVGAVAGTYKTENDDNLLALFVGYEIAWKYEKLRGPVNVHGTYNLAVRKKILEEIGGFNEKFRTAEDADLTYRISEKYTIYFTPESVVGHYHPEKFWAYMKNQEKRGEDRVLLYKHHPNRITNDTYTGKIIKYQVLAGGMLIPSLIFIYPFFKFGFLIPLSIALFILYCSSFSFPYIAKKNISCTLYGIPVQFFRSIAWFFGLIWGIIKNH